MWGGRAGTLAVAFLAIPSHGRAGRGPLRSPFSPSYPMVGLGARNLDPCGRLSLPRIPSMIPPTIGCQDQPPCHSERSEESPSGFVTGSDEDSSLRSE